MEVLAIMGLRSGSKGVPGKNIRKIEGQPLFKWGIDAAMRSKHITRTIVSTDSEDYRQLVLSYGIESPYLRPKKFGADRSPEIEFISDLLQWLDKNENYCPDICIRLLATVPMQTEHDIDSCVSLLKENKDVDSAVVLAESRQHPLKAIEILEGSGLCVPYGKTIKETGEMTPTNREQYRKSYHRANIVGFRYENIAKYGNLIGMTCLPHVICQERGIDIDTEPDFWCAEAIMKNLNWDQNFSQS